MNVQQAQGAVNGVGGWDHLLHWEQAEGSHTPDDALLDTAEEESLADENEDIADAEMADIMSADEEEEQEEQEAEEIHSSVNPADNGGMDMVVGAKGMQQQQVRRGKLISEEITAIINERIEHYTNSWYLNKGIEEEDMIEDNPDNIWDEAHATGKRLSLVQKHNFETAEFTARLDRICEEIMKVPGSNAEKIRQQCRNLETTIDNLQRAEYFLSIYSLEPIFDKEDNAGAGEDEPLPHVRPPHAKNITATTQVAPTITDIEVDSGAIDTGFDDHAVNNNLFTSPIVAKYFAQIHRRNSTDSVLGNTMDLADSIEPVTVKAAAEARGQLADVPISNSSRSGDEPQEASIASIRRWEWQELIDTQDRKRVVSKAVYELPTNAREAVRERLKTVGKPNIIQEILACISMLLRGEKRMRGVLDRDLGKIVTFTRLFSCWWFCDNYTTRELPKQGLKEAVECINDGARDLAVLCSYVDKIMSTSFSPQALQEPDRPSQAEIVCISSDDNEPPPRTQRTTATQNRA